MPVDIQSDRVILKHPKGPSAEILFYGASVISWKSGSVTSPEPVERLFTSAKAALDGSKPVRGGIPVVFPCFGPPTHPDHAKLPQHGFARNNVWTYNATVMDNEAGVSVRLILGPNAYASIKEQYAHPFELAYVVTLAEHELCTNLHVQNTALSTTPAMEFQALFHNYIRAPANDVRVSPLLGLSYYDKTEATEEARTTAKKETREGVDVLKFTDSVYEDAPGRYEVLWGTGGIEVVTKNLKDVVVWNPQAEAGSKIGDMEAGGWLEAGEKWIGQQVLKVKL
ncbi:hypothetical protein GSI_06669 [Ganoderma sinense ZZ0214-1]|uniref:Glucose-6-phosphate 1-epimerase n=1 Tax=Ganoderma sinense ZZ0214-1 TaxID=1077348 RepID=A0A2G8SDW9_9APHY|nr:hypothetical protein GSI_06669 [Ganoderma sinense ZZ0214-1]